MGNSIRELYGEFFKDMAKASKAAAKIDETNVYQPGNTNLRKYIDKLVADNVKPDSRIEGVENFEKFYDLVCSGKSGLILMEHYSNADLPLVVYMLEHSGNPKLMDLAKRIVAIAGMKLNEANDMVRAFAESFTRVVIYPTRSRQAMEESNLTEEEIKAEETRAKKINLAAMRAMDECKKRGEVILVFPSGTRYRPGHPETKRGLREIDSYLRLFDNVLLVSLNGMLLRLKEETVNDMLSDECVPDTMVLGAGEVIECKPFRKNYLASLPESEEDPKQKMIDHVMDLLQQQHDKIEATRL